MKIDRVLGAFLSDDDTTVRLTFETDGRQDFIDVAATELRRILPTLGQIASPRGRQTPALKVTAIQGFGGPDRDLRLHVDLGDQTRVVLGLEEAEALSLQEQVNNWAWQRNVGSRPN
jgi:hypothetical protein